MVLIDFVINRPYKFVLKKNAFDFMLMFENIIVFILQGNLFE